MNIYIWCNMLKINYNHSQVTELKKLSFNIKNKDEEYRYRLMKDNWLSIV